MYLLVDYDNVDILHRKRGITHIVDYIVDLLGIDALSGVTRLDVRLYGGWFLGDALSDMAQSLISELDAEFPRPIEMKDENTSATLLVRAGLARSLLVDPEFDLFYTFRKRGYPGGLGCLQVPFDGCENPQNCPIGPVAALLTSKVCARSTCQVKAKDIIFRAEQKLVDTMLTADIISIAADNQNKIVAIASNDDDVWPGIRTACHFETKVLHVHPRKGRSTPERYSAPIAAFYTQYSFQS